MLGALQVPSCLQIHLKHSSSTLFRDFINFVTWISDNTKFPSTRGGSALPRHRCNLVEWLFNGKECSIVGSLALICDIASRRSDFDDLAHFHRREVCRVPALIASIDFALDKWPTTQWIMVPDAMSGSDNDGSADQPAGADTPFSRRRVRIAKKEFEDCCYASV